MPEISVIIRAYNEEKHLPSLFDALEAQTYRDFETVVVDSGSVDRTRSIARQRADRLVRIRPEDFTFGHSLNTGIANGAGRLAVIVSAHTLPTGREWLARLVAPLADPETAMVYGRQIGWSRSKFSESLDFERTFRPEGKVQTPPDFFANNANSAVRRDLWESHPFDEALPGLEDVEWARYWMERNLRVVYQPEACICHIHAETWAQVRRRYHREGMAAKWIGIRNWYDLPDEVWKETRCFFADLGRALQQGRLMAVGPEIARFRYEKLWGSVGGILDGEKMTSPAGREALFFDKTYRAVVIHGPGVARLEERGIPKLKPGEVLVRVAYQGVCATDLEIYDGTLGYYKSGLAKYPIVPGHEFSGLVAAVGARVSGVAEGDPVVVECVQGCGECAACRKGNAIGCGDRREVGVIGCDGGYAEYVIAPARFVHRLSEEIALERACLCEPLAVVLKGLRRLGRIQEMEEGGRNCAVVGAGPIGHLAARVLARRGHRVTVFDRNPRRLDVLAGSGVGTDRDLGRFAGFDTVVEATGNPDALEAALHNSGAGALILLLGLPYARLDFSFESVVGYDKSIIGSVGSSSEDFEEALAMLPQIDTSAFLEKVFPLNAFGQAWEAARAGTHLKVILKVFDRMNGEL